MKIKKLDDNRVQVVVSKQFLQNKNIDVASLDTNAFEYDDIIMEALTEAEKLMDKDGFGRNISIDLHKDKELNLVIIIKRVTSEQMDQIEKKNKAIEEFMDALNHLPKEVYDELTREIPESKHDDKLVFCFDDFEDLLAACARCPNPKIMPSQLYVHKNRYYLSIRITYRNYDDTFIFEAACKENNATRLDGPEILPILIEHGKPLFKRGAIPSLLRKFEV